MRLALIFGTILLLSCNKNKYSCKCNVNTSSESYEKLEKIEERHENEANKSIICQVSKN